MGVIKDHNFEAMHFLSVNQQVMWAAGFDWYKPGFPDPIYWTDFKAETLYQEHFRLKGRWARFKQWLRREDWGWKDPRNTFTLKMWLELFPEAKVIHLCRNQEDVVRSLQQRNRVTGEVFAEELKDEAYCHDLAERYTKQGRSYAQELGDRYLELNYEKLCDLDAETIAALESFTGKSISRHLKALVHAKA